MAQMYGKLRPDRDLQCYFERPSASAAFSGSSAGGFTVSGTWRQQFDWAVVEWNRDNVIEHPAFRNLPDGDLSGLQLSYEETRVNCISVDSDLYPTVDWPYLRIWAEDQGVEGFYRVPLKDHAIPVEGSYSPAEAELELLGAVTVGDHVGISCLSEHHTYQVLGGDTPESVVQAIADSVNAFSTVLVASRQGRVLKLKYVGEGQTLEGSKVGANGNRIGLYGYSSGAKTETWFPQSAKFSGGTSPSKWRVNIDFSTLVDIEGRTVPTQKVRKLRWTYSADLQAGVYMRTEFSVTVTNWQVSGTNTGYVVAGPGSQRIEENDSRLVYTGNWTESLGNFSGGRIRFSTMPGAKVQCTYKCGETHRLYLGTRRAFNAAAVSVRCDSAATRTVNLLIPGEDVLCRLPVDELGPGTHTVTIEHAGPAGSFLYFDFLEAAIVSSSVPVFPRNETLTLATDWDTDHSLAISPERTAWLIRDLGFTARQNHYVGALWYYELVCSGNVYASATLDFEGVPVFGGSTQVRLGRVGEAAEIAVTHLNRVGDTAETIAKAFELEFNRGYTGIRAEAVGNRLTIFARALGTEGNMVTVAASPSEGDFHVVVSGSRLDGGVNGTWLTDLVASPRINRACRDWSRSFYEALKSYGIEVTAAFSMELQHGDDSREAGIAQRYPNGDAAWLNTPALQTNFSPASKAFWREVYADMATVMSEAGVQPYLQFGEVQWWYFPKAGSGMPFYDDYTKQRFEAAYGRPMGIITSDHTDPGMFPDEVQLLPALIGEFTTDVMEYVRARHPNCRFEVLYPTDVNDTALNRLINYPANAWTPQTLDCLKTESFTFTFLRNLNKSTMTIEYPATRGFPISKRSFLVGINDPTTAWARELEIAQGKGSPSNVLFALDQFCLVGYPVPVQAGLRRAVQQG
ncbi:MAG: hypothetical protein JNN08_11125 [Bryobacterales bacterium]|nr:hypothetical protein [Bryobacterales bacterium]